MREELFQKAMGASSFQEFLDCFKCGCTRCTLSRHGSGPVIHRGNPQARIMLIGEALGIEEERQRKAFCGPAGKLLDKIMAAIGLNTDRDIFISNSAFCRPTAPKGSGKQNYTPKTDQIVMCRPFMNKLIDIINPQILIACGGTALKNLMEDNTLKVTEWEGRWLTHDVSGKDMFVTSHPAAILHQSNWPERQLETKRKVWRYMQYFRDTYREKL